MTKEQFEARLTELGTAAILANPWVKERAQLSQETFAIYMGIEVDALTAGIINKALLDKPELMSETIKMFVGLCINGNAGLNDLYLKIGRATHQILTKSS
jgi:hypothetical protein